MVSPSHRALRNRPSTPLQGSVCLKELLVILLSFWGFRGACAPPSPTESRTGVLLPVNPGLLPFLSVSWLAVSFPSSPESKLHLPIPSPQDSETPIVYFPLFQLLFNNFILEALYLTSMLPLIITFLTNVALGHFLPINDCYTVHKNSTIQIIKKHRKVSCT